MYSVGQVLYVILEKKRTILPVRVAEQIVRRTIKGESISYKVVIPGKNQVVALSDLGSSHFSSLEEVRAELLSNAERMIHSMADQAKSIADECFPTSDNPPELEPIVSSKDTPIDTVTVDLGGGIVGNINLGNLDTGRQL